MKVFISQPMRGKSKEEILNERNKAIEFLKDNNCNIEILADADLLLCIGDWKNARGCKIEHECAKQYGIQIQYWSI